MENVKSIVDHPIIRVYNLKITDNNVEFSSKFGTHKVRTTDPAFIHDFTLNLSQKRSDTFLLGKTPDVVTDSEIIELTTSQSSNPTFLSDKLLMKFNKYKNIALDSNKVLKIIVVSKTHVMANFDITHQEAVTYMERFGIAQEVQKMLLENHNLDLWRSEGAARIERLMKSVLQTAPNLVAKDSFEMTLNEKLPIISIDDWKRFNSTCLDEATEFEVDTHDYTSDYVSEGTRVDYKRVVPVSLLIPMIYDQRHDYRSKLLCPNFSESDREFHQCDIITQATQKLCLQFDDDKELRIAQGFEIPPEKRSKSMYRFQVDLNDEQRVQMAKYGIQAKALISKQEILDKRTKDKECFSFKAPTDDIENFLSCDNFLEFNGYKTQDFVHEAYESWFKELKNFKWKDHLATDVNEVNILRFYEEKSKTILIQYCKFLQALFTEINLSVRENLNKDILIAKPIPGYNCDVYVRSVGSNKPIGFFILAKDPYLFDQMTVGVKYFKVSNEDFYVSEWSTVKLRDIENYLSITTKMLCTMFFLIQLELPRNVLNQHLNFILLLLLSNKDRDEEIVTLLRFVYMRSLSLTDNSTTLTSKLPTVIRSRLNLYQIKRTLSITKQMFLEKPKFFVHNNDRDIEGLIDLFGNDVNFKQALNMSYYGYIVNKTKQSEKNQSSKLIDKILEYDQMIEDGSMLSSVHIGEVADHLHNKEFLAVVCYLAELKVKQTYGENYHKYLENQIFDYFQHQNFLNLATIKASAKMDLPNDLSRESIAKMKEARPKVMENIKKIMLLNENIEHPIELVNYCINKIDKDDCFNVELFSKDQHAGIREIYIVDAHVRIVQWFIEGISRGLCQLFDSETMTNPRMKDVTSQQITRRAMTEMASPIMLCRSGDASKWSQTQNVTKFYQVMTRFLPLEYHTIIRSILILWFRKKIYLPVSLIEICLQFKGELKNDTVNFIRDIYSGKKNDRRLQRNEPFLRVKTGFMQGILHFTSSFFHSVIQEGLRVYKQIIVNRLFPETAKNPKLFMNIILQGSDDNSEIIILERSLFEKNPRFFKMLVQLKDLVSKYVGIKVSKEKTASCVPFLMEYNSTWELAGKFVMPTIKFVFVATDIPQKQTLLGRQEFYYSLLTSCLEKGATILTCNYIRLAQAEQHYLQLGYQHNHLFYVYFKSLIKNKSPALGYFMFEPTVLTGLLGFDFMLYFHSTETSFVNYIQQEEKEVPVQILNNLGYKSIADYSISKHDYEKHKRILGNLNFCPLEESKARINERPEVLYTTLNDVNLELDLMNLKINDFSVKESLTTRFSKSDMFSTLIYILTRPICYFNRQKSSLIQLSDDLNSAPRSKFIPEVRLKASFTRHKQYDEIISDIKPILNTNRLFKKTFVQRGSSKIKILEGINDESIRLIDLCKAKWFGIKSIPVPDSVISKHFRNAQMEIPWLKNSEKETRDMLGCDSFQLYNYLLHTFKESKSITLLDTPGKKGNLKFLMSRITDINSKLIYTEVIKERSSSQKRAIRSNLKFLVEFPFTEDFKIKNIKALLDLYVKTDMRPSEKVVSSLIIDLLNYDQESFLTRLYSRQDELDLSTFIKPQKFNNEENRWEGDGLVIVKSGSLTFELKANNNLVEKISVNKLNLARDKFHVILKYIKSFNWETMQSKEEEALRLNSTGILRDRFGTPVVEKDGLCLNINSIKNMTVKVEHGRIKIITTSKISDFVENTLLNEEPIVPMVKKKNEWIPVSRLRTVGRDEQIVYRNQTEATQVMTFCSLKTRFFPFDPKHPMMFESNELIKFFWRQSQDLNELLMTFHELITHNKIQNYDGLCNMSNLDSAAYVVFRDLFLGQFKSRDEIEQIVVGTSDHIDETSELISALFSFKDVSSVFESFNEEDLIDVFQIPDDLSAFVAETDDFLEQFSEALSRKTKGFYFKYMENYILDSKIFETLMVRMMKDKVDVEKVLEGKLDDSKLNVLTKNLLIGLLRVPGIMSTSGINVNFNKSLEECLIDPNLLHNYLMFTDVRNVTLTQDLIDIIDDQIMLNESSIESCELRKSKIKSIPVMLNINRMISGHEEHNNNLMRLKNEGKREVVIAEEVIQAAPIEDPNFGFFDDEVEDGGFNYSDCIDISGNNLDTTTINVEDELIREVAPSDGGCLFYSLMFSTMAIHPYLFHVHKDNLRNEIVDKILEMDEEALKVLKSGEPDDYPNNMRRIGVWGDDACIMAYALIIKAVVIILDDKGKVMRILGAPMGKYAYILHIEKTHNHFNALIPKFRYEDFLQYKEDIGHTMPRY